MGRAGGGREVSLENKFGQHSMGILPPESELHIRGVGGGGEGVS